jgi:hypothetical protein
MAEETHGGAMFAAVRIAAWTAIAALGLTCGWNLYDSAELNGHVRLDGTPVPGVRMRATWPDDPQYGTAETHTDQNGYYRLFALEPAFDSANWRHVLVVPELAGYVFSPPNLDTVLAHDVQTADFTATPTGTLREVTLLVWWQDGASVEPFEAGFLLVDTTR